MTQKQPEHPLSPRAGGAKIETLPDGSTRVLLSARHSPTRLPGARHEWRLQSRALEVRTLWAGLTRSRRLGPGMLWLQPWRGPEDPRHGLVHQCGSRTTTLAVGEESQLRPLADLIAAHTGWRLRVSRSPATRPTASVMLPFPVFLVLGGLTVAALGVAQARRDAGQIRRLRPVTALELDSSPPGSTALATGTVVANSGARQTRLVVFHAEGYRVQGKGGPAMRPLPQPPFSLAMRDGSITVERKAAELVAPRHAEWVGNQRYTGFRAGDEVTIAGVVPQEKGHASLTAQIIFGGTPAELAHRMEQQGLLLTGVGLTAALFGGLILRILYRVR